MKSTVVVGTDSVHSRWHRDANMREIYRLTLITKGHVLMGEEMGTFLASKQRELDDSLAVSIINNLSIQMATAYSTATVIHQLDFERK